MTLYPCDYNPHHPSQPQYWRTPPLTPKPWDRNGFRWSDLAAEIDAEAAGAKPDPDSREAA